MALKNCNECGKEVSEKALKCPHCGAPHASIKLFGAGLSLMGIGCFLTIFLPAIFIAVMIAIYLASNP